MTAIYDKLAIRAKADDYCHATATRVDSQLGFGTQGMVFQTARDTAIKVYDLLAGYERERNVYRRLESRKIKSIQGLVIPRIHNFDDDRYVIEMSIVHGLCVLDFGGAYLDSPPGHMTRDEFWCQAKAEEFGENWERAQSVIRELEYRADLWLSDVNPGNIKFEKI